MIVEIHNKLGNVQRLEVTRLVVYDAMNNPNVVAVEVEPRVIYAAHADDPEFNELLRSCGITQTVVCQDLRQVPIEQVQLRPFKI